MKVTTAANLACPLDGGRLEFRDKQLVCARGHTFDVARQGYVNLLPVQHKRSKQPGDSKEMVAARARFLDSGVYDPIAGCLADIALARINGDQSACLLDAGCGDGYYSDFILGRVGEKPAAGDLAFIGLDISKAAIAFAARRSRRITWLVGTNRKPPVEAASVDMVFCVFGFPDFAGFADILKPGGTIVLVDPGPDHLRELRQIIYPQVRSSPPPDSSRAEDNRLELLNSQVLRFTTGMLDNRQINDLLMMTPHFYRADRQRREAACKLPALAVSVDLVIRCLQKSQ